MFALVAALMFFLYGFGVRLGDVSLVWLGVGFLALHLAWDVALPVSRFTRRT